MAEIDLLTDEIRRVLTAPYAVWLKDLQDIINKVDKSVLQQWAHGHPCQINALANAVVDGLQQWPYVIDMLGRLCHLVSFRNAVLRIRPVLLDTLLNKAVESQHGYDEYFSTCISMLSAPLPEDTPLPASAASFFLKVMETAVQTAAASTIRPIYSMLAGVGPGLLDVMPEAEVMQFQDRLVRLLRKMDDQTANLLCLAIFARLVTGSTWPSSTAEISSHEPSPASNTIRTEKTSRYYTIEQFFNQKRAVKTLDLVVLRVIFACSNSSNLSLEDSVESLKLAKEIIGAINVEEKDQWLNSNGPKVRKLYEKVLRVDLTGDLQSLAVEVIFSLAKVESFPVQLLKNYQSVIRANLPFITPNTVGSPLSGRAIEYFAPRMDEAFISETIGSILKIAVEQVTPTYEGLKVTQNSRLIVSAFTAAVHQSRQLRSAILFTMSANAFNRPLNEFLTLPVPLAMKGNAEPSAEHRVCPAALARSQRQFRLDVCSLFLQTGLLASTDQAGIEPGLAASLLQKQVELAAAVPTCRCASQSFQCDADLSLVEQTSTSSEHRASSDWRARLSADLLRNAKSNSDSIVRTVNEVCRDLERRCEVVEWPLKEEQARSKQLEDQLEAASRKVAELESQAEERNLFLNGLDAEKNSLECQARAGEARITHLTERLQEMEAESAEVRAEAERASAIAREEASNENLKHLAILNSKEDIITDQDEHIRHLEHTLKSLRDELTAACEATLAAQKRVDRLGTELTESARAREIDRASSFRKDTDIDRLRCVETELRAEVEAAEDAGRQQATKIELLQTEVQDVRASSEANLGTLKQAHESDKTAAATEMARLQRDHQEEIARLSDSFQRTVDASSAECYEKDSTISRMNRKIEKLLRERKEKAKEFAEAQELSTKLMAVMGLKTEQTSALVHNPARSSIKDIFIDSPVTQRDSRGQTTTASAPSIESSTSSKSGPTPKRTRPRRTTRTPSMHRTKIDIGANTVKTAHDTTSRPPLTDLSVSVHNRSPVRTQWHGMGKVQPGQDGVWINAKDQGVEAIELGDLSFGGSDIFTSTEKARPSAAEDYGHSQLYDESTADF